MTSLPGGRWRAPYACDPNEAGGRLLPEPSSPTRSEVQRDRDRIIHSAAFRRLTHKTQVFIYHEGDHYRTRLTHTLEVGQIARALSRSLGLDEDLAEAVALAHDLGHAPFGHTGEDALDECLKPFGGYDHNVQAFRIVTRLERRYAAFDGLNLTAATLEGLVKHNGPLLDGNGGALGGKPVAPTLREHDALHSLGLSLHAYAEAQAAALADDIAYDAHDLDDGLRAGILRLDDLRALPFLADLLDELERRHPGLDETRAAHELTRRVITRFVEDAITESARRLRDLAPESAEDVRRAGHPVVAFSVPLAEADRAIKRHLFPMLYRHERLLPVRRDAEAVVRDLFRHFTTDPGAIPDEWRRDLEGADEDRIARRVGDYIGGMTDRYALAEHRRLFPTTPALRIL